jgi:hypothetical protein
MWAIRSRLFEHASDRWEGETLALKVALIDATEKWERLTGEGKPCPIVFDAEDIRETRKLDVFQSGCDEHQSMSENFISSGPDGWVNTEHYEEAMALGKQLKEMVLAEASTEFERTGITEHWAFDDMDEEKYM